MHDTEDYQAQIRWQSYLPGTWNIHELKWLFQLDDSKPLHEKWLEITIFIHQKLNWLVLGFQVEVTGMDFFRFDLRKVHFFC